MDIIEITVWVRVFEYPEKLISKTLSNLRNVLEIQYDIRKTFEPGI